MKETNCQSCNMPMNEPDDFGKEANGSPSSTYCVHCYQEGDFTWKPTFEEFVDGNAEFWREDGETDNVAARVRCLEGLKTLKRWATA